MKLTIAIILSLVGIPCLALTVLQSISSWMPSTMRPLHPIGSAKLIYDLIPLVGNICFLAVVILGFFISWQWGIGFLLAMFFAPKVLVKFFLSKLYPRGTKRGELAYLFYMRELHPDTFRDGMGGFSLDEKGMANMERMSESREKYLNIMNDDSIPM